MCHFFSFVTDGNGNHYYTDWLYRKNNLTKDNDSHSYIAKLNGLSEDKLNKYEYNPLTETFKVGQINNAVDDRIQSEDWVRKLDFSLIVEPLILKPIFNPLVDVQMVKKVTKEDLVLLKEWASVWDSVRDSVGDSVGASVWYSVWTSVRASVWDSVWASVWASVRDSVWASVRDSVGAYSSSFVNTDYKFNFAVMNDLYKRGLVPSFDGKIWRLHSGLKAKVVWQGKI